VTRVAIRYCAVATALLVALWAFLSYLQPWFSGERMVELLLCY